MLHKRIIFLYIICIALLLLSTFPAGAAGGVIGAGTASAKPGETVDVEVRMDGNPGVVAALLNIDYDVSVLTLTGADNGTVFADDTAVFSKDVSLVPFTVLWEDGLSAENYTADGVLVTLHFTVKDDAAPGNYTITLLPEEGSMLNVDLEPVPFQIENGTVQIGAADAARHTGIAVGGIALAVVVCAAVAGNAVIRRKRKTSDNKPEPSQN